MTLSTHLRTWPLAAFLLPFLALADARAGDDPSQAKTAAEMKPYAETIPGTSDTFAMVPIPGGTFTMGSPEDEEGRQDDEGPQHQVADRPVLDGQARGHLGRVRRVRLQPRHQEEATRGDRPRQAGRDREERRRRHPPDAPLRRHDLRLRPRQPAGHLHDPPRRDGILPLALRQDRQDLPPAHRGRVGIRLPRRHDHTPTRSATTRTKLDDYAWYVENAEKPMPVGKKKPNPWGLYDMHGNVAEWCLDHYVADIYEVARRRQADRSARSSLPTAEEYSYVVRGGSWDDDRDDAPQRRAPGARTRNGACRTPSAPRASGGTPTPPSSASASSAPSRSRRTSRACKSQVVKGEGDHAESAVGRTQADSCPIAPLARTSPTAFRASVTRLVNAHGERRP